MTLQLGELNEKSVKLTAVVRRVVHFLVKAMMVMVSMRICTNYARLILVHTRIALRMTACVN